ncbi:MAG: mannose-1-phosphate guanylyltransferase [Ignavibacteriae bacterium]|nr:mannose-1-phosphate guanylyltransferase [Ignavibacteriota bacterium]
MNKVAVIMAGGSGARLWPRSTEKKPKQFIHLMGDGSMIQNTVARLEPIFDSKDIYIVTSDYLKEFCFEQLPHIPKENIITEPFPKNTAPCIALAATAIENKYTPDTILFTFPSDHVITNQREFHHSLEVASKVAYEKGRILAIGLSPTRPETAFGYIQVKDEHKDLGELYDEGVRFSSAFAEKPDSATAKRFIESGDFLWNSGIFIWRLDTFWDTFKKFLPEDSRLFNKLKKSVNDEKFNTLVEEIYRQIQSESIDYAIMEKAKNVFVVEASFGWSDLGNWDEIYRLSMKDGRNNVIEGDVISINTSNCLVSSYGKMIGVVGVDNLMVIESENSIVICRRGYSDDVKEIVDFLRRKQINKYL